MNHEDQRKAFSDDYSVGYEQRDLAAEDMRFALSPGGQWEGWLPNYGENRPRLQYDMLRDYLNRFMGEWKHNRVQVDFRAGDESDNDDDAEVLTGLHRKDFRDRRGTAAVDVAVWEAALGGCGAFKISAEYMDREDVESDAQVIGYRQINSAYRTVIWDQTATLDDKSDADHVSVIWGFTKDQFEAKYPGRALPAGVEPDHHSYGFRWAPGDRHYVVEQYTRQKRKTLAQVWVSPRTEQRQVFYPEQDEIKERDLRKMGWQKIRERRVERPIIERALFDGNDYVEEPKRVAGSWLPIVPIYCYRGYLDEIEYYQGLVGDKKDPQRTLNLQMSRLAETASEAARRIPVVTPDQIRGLEHMWGDGFANKGYALIQPMQDEQGRKIVPPMQYLEPETLDQSTASLIELNREYLRERTGGNPTDIKDPELSGKALLAMQSREDMGTAWFMDNIRQSIIHAGRVYMSQAKEVYAGERSVTLIGADETEKRVRLGEAQMTEDGQIRFKNDVSSGKFEAIASTGPSYASRREATVETLTKILGSIPPESPYYAPIIAMIIANIDGTGLDALQKLNRQQMLLMGIVDPEDEDEVAMLQQAQQPQDGGLQQQLTQAAIQQLAGDAAQSQASAVEKQTQAQLNMARVQEIAAKVRNLDAETGQIAPNRRAERIEKLQRASQLRLVG